MSHNNQMWKRRQAAFNSSDRHLRTVSKLPAGSEEARRSTTGKAKPEPNKLVPKCPINVGDRERVMTLGKEWGGGGVGL